MSQGNHYLKILPGDLAMMCIMDMGLESVGMQMGMLGIYAVLSDSMNHGGDQESFIDFITNNENGATILRK